MARTLYTTEEPDKAQIDAIWRAILDRIYSMPTWFQDTDGSIHSLDYSEAVNGGDVRDLLSLRRRMQMRYDLESTRTLQHRLEIMDKLIENARKREAQKERAAQTLSWGRDGRR